MEENHGKGKKRRLDKEALCERLKINLRHPVPQIATPENKFGFVGG